MPTAPVNIWDNRASPCQSYDRVEAMTGGDRRGLTAGISAYFIWGMLPVYMKTLKHVPPWDVVAYRALWSIVLCLIALAAIGRLGELARVL